MLPILRWTGSKRYQAEEIVSRIPDNVSVYYEMFLGGGSVLGEYLTQLEGTKKHCDRIVGVDLNKDLISIWEMIRDNPDGLLSEYEKLYSKFEPLDDIGRKNFYNEIRDQYNYLLKNDLDQFKRTILFNWLMRTCFNGLVRYDKNGNFNTSCHFTRHGMTPINMEKLITTWSYLLNNHRVEFFNCSYSEVADSFKATDFMYLDPPYANDAGMYFHESFDNNTFFNWLRQVECKWLLSYDGISGKDNNTYDVPKDLWSEHLYVNSKQSGFKKLVKNDCCEVYDSLYVSR